MTTVQTDNHLIQEITPRNILSFGPDTAPIKLGKLNVLIGPNGAGKSNLIDVIRLLRSCPKDMRQTVLHGGGVTEWIWKDAPRAEALIEAIVSKHAHATKPGDINMTREALFGPDSLGTGQVPLRHVIGFRSRSEHFHIVEERIEDERGTGPDGSTDTFYRNSGSTAVAQARWEQKESPLVLEEPDQSVLKQLRDPRAYPEISYLASSYDKIRIYSDWSFGRGAVVRNAQSTDALNTPLAEDLSNLWLFLNTIRQDSKSKKTIIEKLTDLYNGITDIDSSIVGSTILGYISEGDFNIFPKRLSDGTLRYISLLAILCDPSPPPLICIEEPEIGLHPDILPSLADLLVEASDRTQIIVTTHSDILVDALTEHPEAILIAEKHNGQTDIQHLDPSEIKVWLEKYRLGNLWLPVADIDAVWAHLKARDGWDKPIGAKDMHALLMTTSMETWIIADQKSLTDFFNDKDGKPLDLRKFPTTRLESRNRGDVLKALERATANCSNKYAKGTTAFDVLARLDPDVLLEKLPSFKRVVRILRENL